MRLDVLNQWLGVKTPAEVFNNCAICKDNHLMEFEGEVFCTRCTWDSVLINAEILAAAQLRWQQKRGTAKEGVKKAIFRVSAPYVSLFFPNETNVEGSVNSFGSRPEVA